MCYKPAHFFQMSSSLTLTFIAAPTFTSNAAISVVTGVAGASYNIDSLRSIRTDQAEETINFVSDLRLFVLPIVLAEYPVFSVVTPGNLLQKIVASSATSPHRCEKPSPVFC